MSPHTDPQVYYWRCVYVTAHTYAWVVSPARILRSTLLKISLLVALYSHSTLMNMPCHPTLTPRSTLLKMCLLMALSTYGTHMHIVWHPYTYLMSPHTNPHMHTMKVCLLYGTHMHMSCRCTLMPTSTLLVVCLLYDTRMHIFCHPTLIPGSTPLKECLLFGTRMHQSCHPARVI